MSSMLLLVLLVGPAFGEDISLPELEQEFEVVDSKFSDIADDLNSNSYLKLLPSVNSQRSCQQQKKCKRRGGTCQKKKCPGKSTKDCSQGCRCCLPSILTKPPPNMPPPTMPLPKTIVKPTTGCRTKRKCRKLGKHNGVVAKCQPKTEDCKGTRYSGRKNCKKYKTCDCCVPNPIEAVKIGNQCLVFHKEHLNWTDAVSACQSNGGELVSPSDPGAVLDYVYSNYRDFSFWAGASDTAEEGKWFWLNGAAFDDKLWAKGQPNGGDIQNCLFIFDSTYNDYRCMFELQYICDIGTTSCPSPIITSNNATKPDPSECVKVGSQCLIFTKDRLNWTNAITSCQSIGGDLVSLVDPDAVLDYATKNYRDISFWVGGSDIEKEGTWVWQDGTSFDNFKWDEDQPNGGDAQDCLFIWGGGANYHDYGCSKELRYICAI